MLKTCFHHSDGENFDMIKLETNSLAIMFFIKDIPLRNYGMRNITLPYHK